MTEVRKEHPVPSSLFVVLVFPLSIRERRLAGPDWAGIYSLVILLVGAEGEARSARV